MTWLDQLERELRQVRLPASRSRRILAEFADHLECDPSAEGPLGEPAELARQFADELGTTFARQAAFAGFLALVPLGILFIAVFALAAVYTTNVETGATLLLVLGVQLAFVGGTLALVRAWRLRGAVVISAAEGRVLRRRAATGLAGGAVTLAVLAALASGRYGGVQLSRPALAWTTVGVGAACVAAGMLLLVRAGRVNPVAPGAPADFSFDLGLGVDPWRLAFWIAGGLALCIALAGVVQSDPIDGLVRALGDGLLCLAGFALLGRPLGLRR
ncbi:MAG TPA: hypothetical protein VH541_02920 [Gaiellaceae bacterium]|jgi:uncharacterized protein YfiM (DUF2279 family)